ncbi:sugar phosphate isomerase/epimerase [Akkermansiaceae bacterium]|nr:sugar phosphate isomerase/epimerase [Akkermansiaceae bacterium]MDA7630343.1 sugar phosphate isomerase/epimerase [bacterium]MDA7613462.1 sugar phosphate isomerase/epimerase [Akkermansiaceae bacterium]MDA7615642.1 sugar phosphate isomerase/epimerase [Akkermansiaceae bacterium]MDA7646485.1 sugar phosphate isomerase/epimerase [Akkermansiaceae bacterium]
MTVKSSTSRRSFLATIIPASFSRAEGSTTPWLQISLQQYSFNRMFRSKKLDPLNYPKFAVKKTKIKALEYFNGFFEEKLGSKEFLSELKSRCSGLGVENQLILCRSDLALDSAEAQERKKAAAYLARWGEFAKSLGCHSIRVDCRSKGNRAEVKKQAVDGLNQLCEILGPMKVNAIVENHGNWSSRGDWVKEVMSLVKRENCGTLPDFGNFKDYDKYQGVKDMLPWAKAICAKVHKINSDGEAAHTDFARMLKILKQGGFKGFIGIEFEGAADPVSGVLRTKKLIEKTLRNLG